MIGLKEYKVLEASGGENSFGESLKDFREVGRVKMKAVFGHVETIENGVLYRKPAYTGHAFSKNLKKGQRLQSDSQTFEILFVDNTPRLAVIYLQELVTL